MDRDAVEGISTESRRGTAMQLGCMNSRDRRWHEINEEGDNGRNRKTMEGRF